MVGVGVLCVGVLVQTQQPSPQIRSDAPRGVVGFWLLDQELSDGPDAMRLMGNPDGRGGPGGPGGSGGSGERGRPGGMGGGGGMGGPGGMSGGGGRGGMGGGFPGGAGGQSGDMGGRSGNSEQVQRGMLRMKELLTPPAGLTLVEDGLFVIMTMEDGRTQKYRADGKDEEQNVGGGPATTVTSWNGHQLVIYTTLKDGLRATRTYVASSDLQQLTVTVRVSGAQLPRPILVHQVYQRKS